MMQRGPDQFVDHKTPFEYLHKKQTGGAGQYAKVVGYMEPLDEFDWEEANAQGKKVLFVNQVVGGTIPPHFMPAVEKVTRIFLRVFSNNRKQKRVSMKGLKKDHWWDILCKAYALL